MSKIRSHLYRLIALVLTVLLVSSIISVDFFAVATNNQADVEYSFKSTADAYQKWKFEPYKEIISFETTLRVDFASWQLTAVGEYYRITNEKNGMALTNVEDNLTLTEVIGNDDSQLWKAQKQTYNIFSGITLYNFINKSTGNALSVDKAIPTELQVREYPTAAGAFWGDEKVIFSFTDLTGKAIALTADQAVAFRAGNPHNKYITISSAYRIVNNKSGGYLTYEDKLYSTDEEKNDYSQVWQIMPSAVASPTGYLNIFHVGTGKYLGYDGRDDAATNIRWDLGQKNGETMLSLNGNLSIQTPQEDVAYRIEPINWYQKSGQTFALSEDHGEIIEIDRSVYSVVSATSRAHKSVNWIFTKHNFEGKDVYSLKNEDTGYILTAVNDGGVLLSQDYEDEGNKNQYFEFIEIEPDSKIYRIKSMSNNAILVWDGGHGEKVGTSLSYAAATDNYTWQLFTESGAASVGEGTFRITGQGGTIRALGGSSYNLDVDDKAQAEFDVRQTGQDAQKWTFVEDETAKGTYKIINKLSGKYLTLEEDELFTTATASNDARQLWRISASEVNDYKNSHINISNVSSGQFLGFGGYTKGKTLCLDKLAANGETLLTLSGDFSLTPTPGNYYRLELMEWYLIDGKTLALSETGHPDVEQLDHKKYEVCSAAGKQHSSINWILKEHNYRGRTVYTLQNEDTGYFLTVINSNSIRVGLDYEDVGSVKQYFEFVETGVGTLEYRIKAVGYNNQILVWDGANGHPYGKDLSYGSPTDEYFWQLNAGTAAVGEGTFRISGQGGTIRALGGSYYSNEITVDHRTIYVSNDGNDNNSGFSKSKPIKTIAKLNRMINDMPLTAGNTILFRRGDTFVGEVTLIEALGTKQNPIKIGSYGTAKKRPKIIAPKTTSAITSADTKILVNNAIKKAKKTPATYLDEFTRPKSSKIYSCFKVSYSQNLILSDIDAYSSNDGITYYSHFSLSSGLVFITNTTGITLKNMTLKAEVAGRPKQYMADTTDKIYISDGTIYYPYQGNEYYGFHITGSYDPQNTNKTNVVVDNIKCSGVTANAVNASQFRISNISIKDSPAWGLSIANASDGIVSNCSTVHTGYGVNPNGNAAFMVTSSQNIEFDGLSVKDAGRGPQRYDGVGFDFEGGINQNKITLKNSVFKGIDGSAIMFYHNSQGNQNIIVDNVYISEYNRAGTTEGALNMCVPVGLTPKTYQNTVTIINSTIVQNGALPFYTGYADASQPLLQYKGVNFINCNFVTAAADKSKLSAILDIANKANQGLISDYDWSRFLQVLDFARSVFANNYASEDEVEEAYTSLKNMMEELNITSQNISEIPEENEISEVFEENEVSDEFTYDDFVDLVDNSGDEKYVVIIEKNLPVLTTEMLTLLKEKSKGLIIQKNDEFDEMVVRYTIDEIENCDNPLDFNLIENSENQGDIIKLVTGSKSQIISFGSDNLLPGITKVIIRNNGGFIKGDKLIVSRFENGRLVECGKVAISKDAEFLSFEIDKLGEYVIQNNGKDAKSIGEKKAKNDTFLLIIACVLGAVVLVAGGITVVLTVKRKKRGK